MGFLVNNDIRGRVFLINGTSPLLERRIKSLEGHGATCVNVPGRLATVADLESLGRAEVDGVVDGVFVVPNSSFMESELARLSAECKRRRIPINVTERPELCTFTLPSIYEDGPFQVGVCTNGMGCRLANRLRRNIVSNLPKEIGALCTNVGALRRKFTKRVHSAEEDDNCPPDNINELVLDNAESAEQKLRWLLQMVEYYPIDKLRYITEADLTPGPESDTAMRTLKAECEEQNHLTIQHDQQGAISLVGAGPGSAKLLTTEALELITAANYVLADKLIPEEVLDLVPRQTPVFIARKFPGNADAAQTELLNIGLEQLRQGSKVVRLKQGDPYIYGRGLEEYVFFKDHGFTPHVVPGISSALSAPLIAQISLTYRSVASQLLICTGTGRKGEMLEVPEYVATRTTVFLMAIHRLKAITDLLISRSWDPEIPAVIIERASCPGQRIIRSTLKDIAEASEELRSNPPGLLVVGKVCDIVHKLQGQRWLVES